MIASSEIPAGRAAARAARVPPRRLALGRALSGLGATAERVLVLLVVFAFSQALLPLLLQGPSDPAASEFSNPALRVVSTAVTGAAFLLFAVRWRSCLRLALRERWALALVGLALASTLWSTAPDLSLRRGIGLLAATGFGVYLAARFDPPGLLRLLAVVLGFNALLSLALGVAVPSLGVDSGIHSGAWQGAFTQKNSLGVAMVLTAFTFLLLWRSTRRRWTALAAAGLATALLVLSTSMTALVILGAVVALLPLYHLLRSRSGMGIPVLIFAVLLIGSAGLGILMNSEAALLALGRDATLTGRTDLWASVIDAGRERPWLGYGYSAFLAGPAVEIWRAIGWQPPNAHNGYLDLWLALGLVGVALFACCALAGWTRAIRHVRRVSGHEALWPIAYLSFFLLYNLTESNILAYNSLYWVLFVTSVCLPAAARVGAPNPGSEESRVSGGTRAPSRGRPLAPAAGGVS